MAQLKKPEVIYRKQLPTEMFPPKPFSYAEEQPLSKLKIIWYGFTGQELTPKNFRKYENFALDVKITTLTLLTVGILAYLLFNSHFISESAGNGEHEYEPTYMDYVIDFCIEQYYNLVSVIKNYI